MTFRLKFDPLPDDELRALAARNPLAHCQFEYIPESQIGPHWVCPYCGTINWTAQQASQAQHCAGITKQYSDALLRLAAENSDWKRSFNLYDSAVRRGTAMWHTATGKTGVWPDVAVLVAWLIARYDGANAILDILLREYRLHRVHCPVCQWRLGGHTKECVVAEYERLSQGFCECGYMALPPCCTHCARPFPPPTPTTPPTPPTPESPADVCQMCGRVRAAHDSGGEHGFIARAPLTVDGIEMVIHAYAGARRIAPEVAGRGWFWPEFVRTHDALRASVRLLLEAVPMVVECFQTWPKSSRPQPEDWLRKAGRLDYQSDAPVSLGAAPPEFLSRPFTGNIGVEYQRIASRLAGGLVMGMALSIAVDRQPSADEAKMVVAAYHAGYADATKAERELRKERGT